MLKWLLDSVEGLSDEIKALYKEKDGKWELQAEAPEDPKLKNSLKEFRDKNVTLMKEIEGHKGTISSWEEIGTQEDFKKALKTLEGIKDEKLFDEGKIEEILTKRTGSMKRDHEAQVRKLTERAEKAENALKDKSKALAGTTVDNQIQIAVSKLEAKTRKGAIEDILSRGRSKFLMEEDGKIVARDIHGNPIYGKDGVTPLTIAEWVSELSNEAPYFFEDSRGGGAGGGAGGGGNQMTAEQLGKLPPSERLKGIHRGTIKTEK